MRKKSSFKWLKKRVIFKQKSSFGTPSVTNTNSHHLLFMRNYTSGINYTSGSRHRKAAARRKSLSVVCIFLQIRGPYFFSKSVNQDNYFKMLKDYFSPRILKTAEYKRHIFQQNGAILQQIPFQHGLAPNLKKSQSTRKFGPLVHQISAHLIIFYGDILRRQLKNHCQTQSTS